MTLSSGLQNTDTLHTYLRQIYIDSIRGANDQGNNDLLNDQRRVKVLITRQRVAWFLIADLKCVIRLDHPEDTETDEQADANMSKVKKAPVDEADAAKSQRSTNAIIVYIFN